MNSLIVILCGSRLLQYLQLLGCLLELDECLAEFREAVGDANWIERNHSTNAAEGLGLLLANANIAKRDAPGLNNAG